MDHRNTHIEVSRTLRIDAATFADALVALRREMSGLSQRWSLGDLGSVELDSRPRAPKASTAGTAILTGRLWNPVGDAVTAIRLITRADAGDCDDVIVVTLAPTTALAPWFTANPAVALDLAQAALDELCEELLYHAARSTPSNSSR